MKLTNVFAVASALMIQYPNSAYAQDFYIPVANDKLFVIQLNENNKYYRNSGVITLYDPFEENKILGQYRFVSGGAGKGALPLGHYELGSYRDDGGTSFTKDSKEFRRRWMIRQVGLDDGEAYEHGDKRVLLELHSIHSSGRTAGCLGILGGPTEWNSFVNNLQFIQLVLGTVTFEVIANPEGNAGERIIVHSVSSKKHHRLVKDKKEKVAKLANGKHKKEKHEAKHEDKKEVKKHSHKKIYVADCRKCKR